MTMLARRRFFLTTTAATAARVFVAAPLPAAAGQAFNARNIVGYRRDICRVHVGRVRRFAVQLLKQFLQFGQRLRTGRAGTAFLSLFLPMHFNKCNRIDHFITDFTAGHSSSFHRAFISKLNPGCASAFARAPHLALPPHAAHALCAVVCYTARMPNAPSFETKLCPPHQLQSRISALPRPLVFTNGVFDILHRGHASYLAQARTLGASLLVAVNSDASVRRLGKGPERPINPLEDRMALVAALEPVSLVTWFDDDTPLSLIRLVLPDVLVKGGDWTPDNIVGAADVKSRGGSVHSIPFVHDRSTTATLRRIRG